MQQDSAYAAGSVMDAQTQGREHEEHRRAVAFLDRMNRGLSRGADLGAYLEAFVYGLHDLKQQLGESSWCRFMKTCRLHSINVVLQEDPFTRRSAQKPRGYPGDAVMLDYIYSGLSSSEAARTTERGKAIFECTASRSTSAKAVRDRKRLIADYIDETADRVEKARILSVACGHLREALDSRALAARQIRELIAVDQDRASLEVVARELGPLRVKPVAGSVADILSGGLRLSGFDFIYSAGLYDYLNDRTARALLGTLLGALNSGGRLLIANFIPEFATSAYMEAFMDWHLECRRETDLLALCDFGGCHAISECRTFVDAHGYVAYLELTRA